MPRPSLVIHELASIFGDDCCCLAAEENEHVVPMPVLMRTDPEVVLPGMPKVGICKHVRPSGVNVLEVEVSALPLGSFSTDNHILREVGATSDDELPLSNREDSSDVRACDGGIKDQDAVSSGALQETPPQSPRRALTVEELQEIVDHFANETMRGRSCKFINSTYACVDAQYRLEAGLQHLLVTTSNGVGRSVEVRCNIGQIQDIHTYVGDGPTCFDPGILRCIEGRADRSNLMMTTFLDDSGEPQTFCLIEEDADRREAFLQSMRVLGMYIRKNPSP